MATSSILYAAAKEIGAACDAQNRAFIACKAGNEDPAACLEKGEAVQACALQVLKSAIRTCETTFHKYATCIDGQISQEYMFERCRKQEDAYAECRREANGNSVGGTVTAASAVEQKATEKGSSSSS